MRNMLLLRGNPLDDQHWSWLHLDAMGVARGVIHNGSLADAAAEASGLRVVVLMSGTECLLTSVHVPGRKRKKLLQAVPYALEEQLSDDPEKLHFAVGSQLEDGNWQVAVTNKHYMETLMATLGSAGLDVQHVLPEQLAVPLSESGCSVLMIMIWLWCVTQRIQGMRLTVITLGWCWPRGNRKIRMCRQLYSCT